MITAVIPQVKPISLNSGLKGVDGYSQALWAYPPLCKHMPIFSFSHNHFGEKNP